MEQVFELDGKTLWRTRFPHGGHLQFLMNTGRLSIMAVISDIRLPESEDASGKLHKRPAREARACKASQIITLLTESILSDIPASRTE